MTAAGRATTLRQLPDLLGAKRAAGRPQDLADVSRLEKVRAKEQVEGRERGRSKDRGRDDSSG